MPVLSVLFHVPRLEAYAEASNHLKLRSEDESLTHEQRVEMRFVARNLDREAAKFKSKFNIIESDIGE
tara:strand:+ start:255 stop:458 length:204 start_codon:yes stop_codon:yes gene_type:complete